MKRKHVITFDFDGTITQEHIKEWAKQLISDGHHVFILTRRFTELHKHLYATNPQNQEVFNLCDEIGLPHNKVIYTNNQAKHLFLVNTYVDIHIDDYDEEILGINTFIPSIITIDAKCSRREFVSELTNAFKTLGDHKKTIKTYASIETMYP